MQSQQAANPHAVGGSLEALCRRLPPFPPLANQLIDLFSCADACIHTAETLIRSDGVFSGELLRLANSAEFAAREPFEEVTPAVLYLGFERVRSVIRRVTYARLMKDSVQHPFTLEIHRGNLATAFLCEQLFKAYGEADAIDGFCPYSLGLYLKIGSTALLRAYPKEYPRFLCSRLPREAELLVQEQARFRFSHVTVSTFLVKQWGFPEAFQALVEGHTKPIIEESPLSPAGASRLAWRMAGSLGFSCLKGFSFPQFEELQSCCPAEPRISLPSSAADWQSAIQQHLEALKITK